MENNCHPIENVLNEALNNLKNIIDINTVVGDAIKTDSGVVIIPISKVSLGYVGGGSEMTNETVRKKDYPFATGAGAGLSITPIGFLIEEKGETRFIQTNVGETASKFFSVCSDLLSSLKKKKENENVAKED